MSDRRGGSTAASSADGPRALMADEHGVRAGRSSGKRVLEPSWDAEEPREPRRQYGAAPSLSMAISHSVPNGGKGASSYPPPRPSSSSSSAGSHRLEGYADRTWIQEGGGRNGDVRGGEGWRGSNDALETLVRAARMREHVPRPPTEGHEQERARDAMIREFVRLAEKGHADTTRTLGALVAWQAYRGLFGPDPSFGLVETVEKAVLMKQVVQNHWSVEGLGLPRWLKPDVINDESACRAFSACIGQQIVLHTNRRFTNMFLSGNQMESRIRAMRLVSLYIWSFIVVPEDVDRFYAAFMETIFSVRSRGNWITVRCRSKTQPGGLRCLVNMEFVEGTTEDGQRIRSYCVRIWPLTYRDLRTDGPSAPLPVVMLRAEQEAML